MNKGQPYDSVVKKIRLDRPFEDFKFDGEEPTRCDIINGVKVWYNGNLTKLSTSEQLSKIISEGDIYIGAPSDFKDGSIEFESKSGKVQIRKIELE